MKEAINQYLDREEEREQLKKASLASWQAYQEMGLHVTGDEVKDWLATWGEAEQKSKLECHKSSLPSALIAIWKDYGRF